MNTIKKLAIAGATTAIMFSSFAGAAFAAPGTDPNPDKGNDASGYPYSAPGYDSAIDNTECADHGAFTYYSHGVIVGYDIPRAADGTQTGYNNSHLCGNPQN